MTKEETLNDFVKPHEKRKKRTGILKGDFPDPFSKSKLSRIKRR